MSHPDPCTSYICKDWAWCRRFDPELRATAATDKFAMALSRNPLLKECPDYEPFGRPEDDRRSKRGKA